MSIAKPDPLRMFSGTAVGGPRDGVTLTATLRWDGRIAKETTERRIYDYPGAYRWNGRNWVWRESKKSTNRRAL